MQISRLFDEYWIHENFSKTQTHSCLILVKTLAKLLRLLWSAPISRPWARRCRREHPRLAKATTSATDRAAGEVEIGEVFQWKLGRQAEND